MTRRILLAVALLLAAPSAAHAATLTNTSGRLTYTGAAGKTTDITLDEATKGIVTITTASDDGDPISATGCAHAASTFTCAAVTSLALSTGDGDDIVNGSSLQSPATVDGGAGDDAIDTGDGDDAISGGSGDDFLSGGTGADELRGGAGIDQATVSGNGASVTLDDVANDGTAGQGANVHSDVEDVQVTSAGGTATVSGSDAGNRLVVDAAKAVVTGGPGADSIFTASGDDTIDLRDGWPDRVDCGAGTDTVLADQYDQVASSCENVTVTPVVGGADDRPPTLAWTAPTPLAALSADAPATLAVAASDDHGVGHVQFFDDDRLLCDVTAPPFVCGYAPRGSDVGRDTLVAVAIDSSGQTTSAFEAVTVKPFTPRSFSLKLAPSRDRKAPYRFVATGTLSLPAPVAPSEGCSGGQVTVTAKHASKTVLTSRATLSRHCEYTVHLTLQHRVGSKLTVSSKFAGNAVVRAATAKSRTARTG